MINKRLLHIHKSAKRLIKQVGGIVNFQNVKHYCERIGFKVLLYGKDASVDITMKSLKIDLPECERGIVYDSNNNRFIFINDKLDEFARLEALLHEVGHIVLEHKNSMLRYEVQECEANTFSLCVLADGRLCKHMTD